MPESSSSAPVPEFDAIDLEAIQLHFDMEDRWECYRNLQQCIQFLVKREKVYAGSESSYLVKGIVKYSDQLARAIVPEAKISEALELLNELLSGRDFPQKYDTAVEALLKHVNHILISFKVGNAIPYKTNWGREPSVYRNSLQIKKR